VIVKIINRNSADVPVTAVRARQAPKLIKMNIIEKRRKAKRRKAKRRKARYYCIENCLPMLSGDWFLAVSTAEL
jgi:hypothetical protein